MRFLRLPQHRHLLIGAVILVAVALLSLILRSRAALFEFPLTEDGYYLLAVARNIALGHGVTIDGQRLTNGFQPLFALLLVPIYALTGGDRYAALRGVLATHWLLHSATAALLGRIVYDSLRQRSPERAALAGWTTACLWLASRYIILNSYNGLETGCALLFYALAWYLYQRDWLHGVRRLGLGAVLGLLVLARIDAAIFVAMLAASEVLRRDPPLPTRLARAVTLAGVALVISLPWWLYNLRFFGSLMPSSGTAQSQPFSTTRIVPMVQAVLLDLVPYLQIRWIEGLPQMVLQALISVGVGAVFARAVYPHVRGSRAARFGAVLLAAAAVLCGYYLLASGAPHFYGRYLAPLMLIAVPLTAAALAHLPRFREPALAAVLIPVFLIAMLSVAGYHLQRGVARSPFYNDQLALIAAHVPPDATVGAAQSGTVGYFRDRVVNLDGKVNAAAIPYRDTMWVYLEQQQITWFCDWSTTWLGPDPAANGWELVAKQGKFMLFQRRPRIPQ